MTNRIMGDSTDIRDIPNHVDIVACYINGHEGPTTPAQLEARFPNSQFGHVFIDVNGSRPDAQVRDWENGDKGGNLRNWVVEHNKHSGKKDAVVYCNRSTVPEVRRLTGDQILNQDYFLWIATGDGDVVNGTGVVACQNKWSGLTGGHWDSSLVFNDLIWRPTGNPSPPQPPHPSDKPNCSPFQRAIRTVVDNKWGPDTDKNADALIKSWVNEFPYGVAFAQHVVGTRIDGIWGGNSRRSMRTTTRTAQAALKGMGFNPGVLDGIWGRNTQKAYDAARKACHI